MDYAETCSRSHIQVTVSRFDCDTHFVSGKTFVSGPMCYIFAVITKLCRLCITAYKDVTVLECFHIPYAQSFCVFGKLIRNLNIFFVTTYAFISTYPDSAGAVFGKTVYGNIQLFYPELAERKLADTVAVGRKPKVVFAVTNDFVDFCIVQYRVFIFIKSTVIINNNTVFGSYPD